jgi:hypothetical protein
MAAGELVSARPERTIQKFILLDPVDIAAPGHVLSVSWNPVAGATAAEVTSASLTLLPAVAEETHASATFRSDGAGWSIDIPAKRRLRAIALVGFKQPGGNTLTESLPPGMRLSVAFPPVKGGGFDSPRFAVPPVNRDHAVPQTLTGAMFSGGVLRMTPATDASRVRVALVDGENPSSFNDQPTELTRVNLTTHAAARNAKVTGPDGVVAWQVPEFDPDAEPVEIDLRQVLEAAFSTQARSGKTLEATITIVADAPAKAVVVLDRIGGFLVRAEDGVVRTVLEGDPATPEFAGAFASEQPASVVGDLTIRYDGIRILETVSDPLPAATAIAGVVVGPGEAVRAFAPQALEGRRPARIGLFGRAPEACELAVEFVQMIGDTAGPPLSPPAVIAVTPDSGFRTHWAMLPDDRELTGAAGIRVRANSGRFFWAFNGSGLPLVRVAIHDPDPGGRPVFLGSAPLQSVAATDFHQLSFAYPPGVMRGPVPALRSDLFLTVDISDLTLRYAR